MPSSSNFPISPCREKHSSIAAKEVDTAASEVSTCQINPSIEKSLLRKLDLHVVLPLMILFVLAFLDRVNIGNAKIQGMTGELKMVGNDFNVALMIFFPSYIFFEFPSNLILRRLPPSLWLTIIMTLWGITTVCQGLVRSQSALCLVIAYLTDRLQHRFVFTIAGVAVGIIGYVILLCQSHIPTGAKYMACFFITTGGYMTQPVTWAWVANNMAGHYKRSISTALQIGVGNIGGIVASNIFITNQAPRYPVGYGVSLGMLVMCGIMCTVFFFGLKRENGIRDRGGRDYRYGEDEERKRKNREGGKEEEGNWGDDWPGFRFVL
ncbi:hypothetical protein BGAL_0055g00110 [Botrytis galanthina]|uniref:Major facilitator superfamily (MFS) profile domain-containing protein n=1 Tax=Botrytis galanthina TaxID=278940 RepID=A0A4S8R8E5_9HELO|nr:hypothetical protein BGAL_0055g00110 [Botrytis galanthina]